MKYYPTDNFFFHRNLKCQNRYGQYWSLNHFPFIHKHIFELVENVSFVVLSHFWLWWSINGEVISLRG